MSKGKVFWKIVWDGDENGNPLPAPAQKNTYWVFTDTEPAVFVCSGSTLVIAQRIALGLGHYFEGDVEPNEGDVPASAPEASSSTPKTRRPQTDFA